MTTNPLLRMSADGEAVLELKKRLVMYFDSPPGPQTARKLYDLFMERFSQSARWLRSTLPGDLPEQWVPSVQEDFESVQLPRLRQGLVWGYALGEGKEVDERSFMFHGFRPASEPGLASIARFDFEWDFAAAELLEFAKVVLAKVECVSASAGYVLNPNTGDHGAEAYRLMYAWARRYWGAQAQHLEADVVGAMEALPCVAWLTFVGPLLLQRHPGPIEEASKVAYAATRLGGGMLLQVEPLPRLIDRNRREPLGRYPAVAKALQALQIEHFEGFDDVAWDEHSVAAYQHRFTAPA